MYDEQLREMCRKLKPVLGRRADALWFEYSTSERMDHKAQIASIIQECMSRFLVPTVDDMQVILPPPRVTETHGEFPFGRIQYAGNDLFPLYLTRDNLTRHCGIFGMTGSGKTNACLTLVLGLLKAGIPTWIIDWKRSFRALKRMPYEHTQNLTIYTVGRKSEHGFLWNPLRPPPGVHPKSWISVIAESLERSHISGQGVADVLIELLDDVFTEMKAYEVVAPSKYPNFFDLLPKLKNLNARARRGLWADSCGRILRSLTFGPQAAAFNARNPLKIEELLNKGVIFELDQELPRPLRGFFTECILRWVHLYRLTQGETSRLRNVLVLEECHHLFPKSSLEKQASNSLETVFREIRGFGTGLVAISQHPSLVPVYVLGNLNTQCYLSLQHRDDVEAARRALFLNFGEEVYLNRLLIGEAIVKIVGRIQPCHVKFPLVPIPKIGDEGGDEVS